MWWIKKNLRGSYRDRGWLVVLMLGAVLGWGALRGDLAQGQDNRITPTREAFKSGSERSEPLLRDMLAVLERIDARLERIEAAAVARTSTSNAP